jgi:predicted N-acetyltransferase YhbS
MRIEIREGIDDRQWQHLTGWADPVFPIEGRPLQWSPSRWHVLAFDDGEFPVAHIGFDAFAIESGGQVLKVIGVGGVVVRPELQGKGIPGLLFKELHHSPLAQSLSSTFTLFCPHRLVGYYEGHGYVGFDSEVSFLNKGNVTQSSDFRFMWHGEPLQDVPLKLHCPPW